MEILRLGGVKVKKPILWPAECWKCPHIKQNWCLRERDRNEIISKMCCNGCYLHDCNVCEGTFGHTEGCLHIMYTLHAGWYMCVFVKESKTVQGSYRVLCKKPSPSWTTTGSVPAQTLPKAISSLMKWCTLGLQPFNTPRSDPIWVFPLSPVLPLFNFQT